jgi:hypothetical protein
MDSGGKCLLPRKPKHIHGWSEPPCEKCGSLIAYRPDAYTYPTTTHPSISAGSPMTSTRSATAIGWNGPSSLVHLHFLGGLSPSVVPLRAKQRAEHLLAVRVNSLGSSKTNCGVLSAASYGRLFCKFTVTAALRGRMSLFPVLLRR